MDVWRAGNSRIRPTVWGVAQVRQVNPGEYQSLGRCMSKNLRNVGGWCLSPDAPADA